MITPKGRTWIGALVLVVTILLVGQTARYHSSSLPESLTWISDSVTPSPHASNETVSKETTQPQSLEPEPGRRFAFATFLAAPDGGKTEMDDKDGYFISTRVLAYQFLHNPETKNNATIDFIILVTEDVQHSKRKRLEDDGAIVIEVPKLLSPWLTPKDGRWQDVLTKLRLFQLTNYDLICFIDADHLVTQSLEGVFDDPASQERTTRPMPGPHVVPEDMLEYEEPTLPETYIFGSKTEAGGPDHPYPPPPGDYLNIGFFVLRPDPILFAYYEQLMSEQNEGLFSTQYPEQDLMNFAHRRDKGGRMPWQQLWYGWNMNFGTDNDYNQGARSFHGKFWQGGENGMLTEIWREQRGEMYGFWKGRAAADQEWELKSRNGRWGH